MNHHSHNRYPIIIIQFVTLSVNAHRCSSFSGLLEPLLDKGMNLAENKVPPILPGHTDIDSIIKKTYCGRKATALFWQAE